MKLSTLEQAIIPQVEELLGLGAPFLHVRGTSDYWLYANLFSSTCPVAFVGDVLAGVAIGFRSQENPSEIYVQDVMSHPDHRQQGITRALLDVIKDRGREWDCDRIYLTSEPDNRIAHATWLSLGFVNVPGNIIENGVSVTVDYKGPGRHRAVYEIRKPW